MKIIAHQPPEPVYLVQINTTFAVVVDDLDVFSRRSILAALARGYWEPWEGEDIPEVLEAVRKNVKGLKQENKQ